MLIGNKKNNFIPLLTSYSISMEILHVAQTSLYCCECIFDELSSLSWPGTITYYFSIKEVYNDTYIIPTVSYSNISEITDNYFFLIPIIEFPINYVRCFITIDIYKCQYKIPQLCAVKIPHFVVFLACP